MQREDSGGESMTLRLQKLCWRLFAESDAPNSACEMLLLPQEGASVEVVTVDATRQRARRGVGGYVETTIVGGDVEVDDGLVREAECLKRRSGEVAV